MCSSLYYLFELTKNLFELVINQTAASTTHKTSVTNLLVGFHDVCFLSLAHSHTAVTAHAWEQTHCETLSVSLVTLQSISCHLHQKHQCRSHCGCCTVTFQASKKVIDTGVNWHNSSPSVLRHYCPCLLTCWVPDLVPHTFCGPPWWFSPSLYTRFRMGWLPLLISNQRFTGFALLIFDRLLWIEGCLDYLSMPKEMMWIGQRSILAVN